MIDTLHATAGNVRDLLLKGVDSITDTRTGQTVLDGAFESVPAQKAEVFDHVPTLSEVIGYIARHSVSLADPDNFLGAWSDRASGTYGLDVATRRTFTVPALGEIEGYILRKRRIIARRTRELLLRDGGSIIDPRTGEVLTDWFLESVHINRDETFDHIPSVDEIVGYIERNAYLFSNPHNFLGSWINKAAGTFGLDIATRPIEHTLNPENTK